MKTSGKPVMPVRFTVLTCSQASTALLPPATAIPVKWAVGRYGSSHMWRYIWKVALSNMKNNASTSFSALSITLCGGTGGDHVCFFFYEMHYVFTNKRRWFAAGADLGNTNKNTYNYHFYRAWLCLPLMVAGVNIIYVFYMYLKYTLWKNIKKIINTGIING